MPTDWLNALIGGVIIGVSVSAMLLWNGRVTGISGIVNGTLKPQQGDLLWRILFVAGLLVGGLVMNILRPKAFEYSEASMGVSIAAGLLVGFGTILGSGCTSGHGVCGISRMSVRSVIATLVFVAAGVVTVAAFRALGILS